MACCIEALVQRFEKNLGYGQNTVILVYTLDNVPGCIIRVRFGNRAFRYLHEALIELPVFPVPFINAPCSFRVRLQRLKSLLLRIPAQVHPEFQNQHAVVGQCSFEGLDALELRDVFEVCRAAVDPIEEWR